MIPNLICDNRQNDQQIAVNVQEMDLIYYNRHSIKWS